MSKKKKQSLSEKDARLTHQIQRLQSWKRKSAKTVVTLTALGVLGGGGFWLSGGRIPVPFLYVFAGVRGTGTALCLGTAYRERHNRKKQKKLRQQHPHLLRQRDN